MTSAQLSRREFIKLGVGALASSVLRSRAQSEASHRPDVVLLVSHLTGQTSPLLNGQLGPTAPALERMAREGFSFENCIGQYPFGGPCWAMLLTGRWPRCRRVSGLHSGRVVEESGHVTLGRAFAQAGYTTSYIGHWYLSTSAKQTSIYGFDRLIVPTEGSGETPENTIWITDQVVSYLAEQRSRPFFLVGAWEPSRRGQGWESEVGALDRDLDRILHQLEGQGTLDETIVVYTDLCNAPASERRRGSQSASLEARQVPLIARWPPGIRAGGRSTRPVGPVDVMPTLCALTALPVPPDCAGRDYSSIIASSRISERMNRGDGLWNP